MPVPRLSLALQRAVGFEHLGYGTFGLNLEKGFKALGVDVKTPPSMDMYHLPPENYGSVLLAGQPGHGSGKWAGQHSTCFTMWESQRLPEGMSSKLHNYDLVIVPNDSNVELFSKYNSNTVKVPLGYDEGVWCYENQLPVGSEFRFLFCGAGAVEKTRKGSDLVVRAFELAFPGWKDMTPSPRLVVKCLKAPPEPKEFMTLNVGRVSIAELRYLYGTCHVMVVPSRGEGWGYHPQQAVGTGMPAILSDIPGHAEYAWLPGFTTIPTKSAKAGSFLQGNGGDWWEPDLDSLVEAMRDHYHNLGKYQELAKAGSWELSARFGCQHMAQKVVDAIGAEHMSHTNTGDWVPFTELLYRTVTTRNLGRGECDVGGKEYVLLEGEEYWVPCNVRLVLMEAGYVANVDEISVRMDNCG